ncbi:PIN domain-containing protein [Halochromatium glycolicum]|uniref:PIN domain-containing protein n=1 Tax=Halochromatium glycolicum TaxID=85075 RepID=A0AAJ0XA04_9GAMM|nr:hypothetical protein [Halochromatium glycolicum]
MDLMIAAHALAEGATLITNDGAFARVPGLTIQAYEQVGPPLPTTSSPSFGTSATSSRTMGSLTTSTSPS